MKAIKTIVVFGSIFLMLSFSGCGVVGGGEGFNLFPPEQDVELGREVASQIAQNPKEYPILPERGNEEIYRYVRGIAATILNSGKVDYQKEFAWQVQLIDDDKTLNAFATPGGYIYVYTGLIRFLDAEDQLAGVLAHEIAHAAERHSTRQMSKVYGISALVAIATGNANPGLLEDIALGLLNLSFSRGHETEADMASVLYLCETGYEASGAADFFQKMEGAASPPAFLSTHPNPANRIAKIHEKAKELGCKGKNTYRERYQRMKNLLR